MRRNADHYEYIAVYVDDLAIAAKDPKSIVDELVEKHNYKLKGVGPIKFHLGCDFNHDPDGTLAFGPRTYITRMMDSYEKLFGEKPKEYVSPLDKGDHPEIDDSPLLEQDGIAKYQSMIGACQGSLALGDLTLLLLLSHCQGSELLQDVAIWTGSGTCMGTFASSPMHALELELACLTTLSLMTRSMTGVIQSMGRYMNTSQMTFLLHLASLY